jgi:hypothetical protein
VISIAPVQTSPKLPGTVAGVPPPFRRSYAPVPSTIRQLPALNVAVHGLSQTTTACTRMTIVPFDPTSTFSSWMVSPAKRNVWVNVPASSTNPAPAHVPAIVFGPVRWPAISIVCACGAVACAGTASTAAANSVTATTRPNLLMFPPFGLTRPMLLGLSDDGHASALT